MTSSEIQEWIQKYDDDPMVVSVSDPEFKTGGFFSKKKTYYFVRASSRAALTSVTRSYKDFLSLHTALVARFRGGSVPPAPPEKLMGSTQEDFITKRMHLLESFLQTIVDNPFLRKDTVFEIFISEPNDFDISLKNFDMKSESEGTKMWKKALESVSARDDNESLKLLKDVDRELDMILKSLAAVKAMAKMQAAALGKYAEATRALASAFESWQAREESNISVLRGIMTRPDGSKVVLAHEVKAIVTGTSATASVLELEYGASQMEQILCDAIRFEIAQAERWKEQCLEAQAKFRAAQRAADAVKAIQVSLGNASSKTSHSEKHIATLTENLAKAKQIQKETLAEQHDYQKGLLVIELERYRKQRTVRIEGMSALLARLHLRGANMIKCAWDGTGVEFIEPATSVTGNSIASSRLSTLGVSSFFKRKSFTRTASGRLRVKGTDTGLEEELRREASTMAAPRPLAIQNDEHRVTLKAKRDYIAKKNDELNLKEGETVTAVRIDDEMWYATNSANKSGLVPSAFVGVPTSDNRGSVSIPSPTNSLTEEKDSERSSSGPPAPPAPPVLPPAPPTVTSPPLPPPAPPGMNSFHPPPGPPVPPPSRDPNMPFSTGDPHHHPPPPKPPQLPDFMMRKGSEAFNVDVPPLPKNAEAMAALKAKLMQQLHG